MIYFDNAATTFPKPLSVERRASEVIRRWGGNPGRSAHSLSMAAEAEVFACRSALAGLFGSAPERVVFTYNTTYALNMAMKSLYKFGRILISDLEHNSVRRPAAALTADLRTFDTHPELPDGDARTSAILASIREQLPASLIVCTAASNVCGVTLPIRAIGELCRKRNIPFIVDGAQAAGVLPLDVEADNIDILCVPGHKGLYGLQGSAAMIFSEHGVSLPRRTFIEGGNGVNSLEVTMPDFLPEHDEGGTLAVPAIAGLRAGIETLNIDAIRIHETSLFRRLRRHLERLGERVTLYVPEWEGSILLFNIAGKSSAEVSGVLNKHGICVRSGFHCAPLAHKRLSTGTDGAVRVSFGRFNTVGEVDRLAEVLGTIR
ncbi:MAG: aminotransferase class V-fold PLP-dependent enzyme [Clostridia bacterium]|nr:aminotransferase class V-fold PLP-dependent enzyme [Clostridia bacterium]